MTSRRNRLIWSGALFMLLGILVAGYVLTFHLDTFQRVVLQYFDQTFGENLHVGQVQVSFFPHPQLELEQVRIHQQGKTEAWFEASRLRVDLSLLSLIKNEVVPNELLF